MDAGAGPSSFEAGFPMNDAPTWNVNWRGGNDGSGNEDECDGAEEAVVEENDEENVRGDVETKVLLLEDSGETEDRVVL